jgi:hypothetical protein
VPRSMSFVGRLAGLLSRIVIVLALVGSQAHAHLERPVHRCAQDHEYGPRSLQTLTTHNRRQFRAPTHHVPRSMSFVGRLAGLLSRIVIVLALVGSQAHAYGVIWRCDHVLWVVNIDFCYY